ncbi:aldehyde dehydrogenase family protein [Cellulosimicrobium protaetiae]|uniref:Aldehyde dehydrogenase family protein n=1 Tax=Cellulosimicrobium protaetiae TaxID=2587808 RepID=A0A6M5UID0_9MICO|nr:aldehyde dehydrogenase family protein [Cellulosimicrobium protaetiae]QJW37292.1 aldehyde dehydrogenase family protein [Cellulosimicrobium protaetiae]
MARTTKATASTPRTAPERLGVRKTYKLYVGGKFPRSESGRTYEVTDTKGRFLANVAQGSRKDAREAVVAARAAQAKWAGATAYNRGQVLYRVAEMLEGRREQFVAEVVAGEGLTARQAELAVSEAIDRWVWYAGWTDKVAQVAGSANPVAGPYFNLSSPEPTGVVVCLAPQRSSLLGLVSTIVPPLVTGNAVIVVASEQRPIPAVTLSEVLATSDVPGGVVNVLTGFTKELAPPLASHLDVNALDLAGAVGAEGVVWGELEAAAADSVKRVLRPAVGRRGDDAEPDWTEAPRPQRILAFTETKTVWHPKGV